MRSTFTMLVLLFGASYLSIAQQLPPQMMYEDPDRTMNALIEDDQPMIRFFGSQSISTMQELQESIGSSGKFGLSFHPFRWTKISSTKSQGEESPQREKDRQITVLIGYNKEAVIPNSVNRDSLSLSSLMFPEAGNTGFMGSIIYRSHRKPEEDKKLHSFNLQGDFSLRQVSISRSDFEVDSLGLSRDAQFTALNYGVWVYYGFDYYKDKNHVTFNIGPYYNWFNLPNEDQTTFESVFGDALAERSYIHSLGVKLNLSWNNFTFFADFRQNFGNRFLADSSPYKGFVFNIGTAVTTQIFKID